MLSVLDPFVRRFICLPRGAATLLVAGPGEWLRAVCTWYGLKQCYVGGAILDYAARLPELLARLGISRSTFYEHLRLLEAQGFLVRDRRKGNLYLKGRQQLRAYYAPRVGGAQQTSAVSKDWNPVHFSSVRELRQKIELLAVQENLRRQAWRFRRRQENAYLGRLPGLSPSADPEGLSAAARKRKLRGFDFTRVHARALTRWNGCPTHSLPFADADHFGKTPTRRPTARTANPIYTLGRQGLARVLGAKSAATGSRWAARARQAGLLQEEVDFRQLTTQPVTYQQFQALRQDGTLTGAYCFYQGHVYRRSANQLFPQEDALTVTAYPAPRQHQAPRKRKPVTKGATS